MQQLDPLPESTTHVSILLVSCVFHDTSPVNKNSGLK